MNENLSNEIKMNSNCVGYVSNAQRDHKPYGAIYVMDVSSYWRQLNHTQIDSIQLIGESSWATKLSVLIFKLHVEKLERLYYLS